MLEMVKLLPDPHEIGGVIEVLRRCSIPGEWTPHRERPFASWAPNLSIPPLGGLLVSQVKRPVLPRNRHSPLAMRTAHNIGYWSGQVPDVCFGLRVAQDESSLCLNGARRGDHVRF